MDVESKSMHMLRAFVRFDMPVPMDLELNVVIVVVSADSPSSRSPVGPPLTAEVRLCRARNCRRSMKNCKDTRRVGYGWMGLWCSWRIQGQ